jgi:microcystin-dependent protein
MTRDGQAPATANLNMGGFKLQGLGPGTLGTDAVSVSQLATNFVPIGTVLDYAGGVAPANYILCEGQAISRTFYAALFSVIGTLYGIGDGTTTFNLPDCRGRVTAMIDPTSTILTSATMTPDGLTAGAIGGTQTHVLTTPETPAHTHTASVTDPGHFHQYGEEQNANAAVGAAIIAGAAVLTPTSTSTTGITVSNSSTGGGGAHLNVQPTILMVKIIKVQ